MKQAICPQCKRLFIPSHGNTRHCSAGCRRKTESAAWRAHNVVMMALKSGQLIRPTICESCGESRSLDAHHDDYLRPLDVRWLCRACHRNHHAAVQARSYGGDVTPGMFLDFLRNGRVNPTLSEPEEPEAAGGGALVRFDTEKLVSEDQATSRQL